MGSIAPPRDDVHAVTPDRDIALPDPRLEAFRTLLDAVDRHDWKAGQLATRRLRAIGYSVVIIRPSGDRKAT